jgi:hypothetical protein
MTARVATRHKEVKVKAYGQEDYVDERLVSLAKGLWRCGIDVAGFFANDTGWACLDFDDSADAVEFMNLVAVYDDEPGSLYRRMGGEPDTPGGWDYWVKPWEDSMPDGCGGTMVTAGGPIEFSLISCVSFPLSDVPLLVQRLSAHRREDLVATHDGKPGTPLGHRPGEGTGDAFESRKATEGNGKGRTTNAVDVATRGEDEAAECCSCCGLPASGGGGDTEHKQVHIEGYGQDAEVDELIAPLILELWRCGIHTSMSCQEGPDGFVWVYFPDTVEAKGFLQIVAPEYDPDPEGLYHRVLGHRDAPDNWVVEAQLEDDNLFEAGGEDEDEEDHLGEPEFGFAVSVWFPPADLAAVMARLAARPTADWEGA